MLQDIVFRAEMCLPRKCTECAKHHVVSKNAYLFWSHALAYTLQHVHLSSVFWFWLAHFRQMHLAYAPVMNDNACLLCIATINHLNKCVLKYITAVTFQHSLVSTDLFAWQHLAGDKSEHLWVHCEESCAQVCSIVTCSSAFWSTDLILHLPFRRQLFFAYIVAYDTMKFQILPDVCVCKKKKKKSCSLHSKACRILMLLVYCWYHVVKPVASVHWAWRQWAILFIAFVKFVCAIFACIIECLHLHSSVFQCCCYIFTFTWCCKWCWSVFTAAQQPSPRYLWHRGNE